MKFTDDELAFVSMMLDNMSDTMAHNPDEWDEKEEATFNSLYGKFCAEFKVAGVWWAR